MNDRGASQVLSYTLAIAIATILIVGLLTASSGFVESQRNTVVDSELRVIGERLSADIATTDRLVRMNNGSGAVNVTSELPSSVAGSPYTIEVTTEDGNASLALTSDSLDRSIELPIANTTAIDETTVSGGDLVVRYDESNDRLEVRND